MLFAMTHWSFIVGFVVSSLIATAINVTTCDLTAITTAGTYVLRDCPNVSLESIPSTDIELVIINSTIYTLRLNNDGAIREPRMINISISLTNCIVLCTIQRASASVSKSTLPPSPLSSASRGVSLMVNHSTISFQCNNNISCKREGNGYFLYVPGVSVSNVSVIVMHSTIEIEVTAELFALGNYGMLRIAPPLSTLSADNPTMENIYIAIVSSSIRMHMNDITSGDGTFLSMPSLTPSVIHVVKRFNGSEQLTNGLVANLTCELVNVAGELQGSSGVSLVEIEGFTVTESAFRMENVSVVMRSMGRVDSFTTARQGFLVDLGNSIVTRTTVFISASHLHLTTVAGTLAVLPVSSALKSTKASLVTISGGVYVTVSIHSSVLEAIVAGGQFSGYYGGISSFLVGFGELGCRNVTIIIRNCVNDINVSMMSMCPYRRLVNPKPDVFVNMSSLAISFLATQVYVVPLISNLTAVVTNSTLKSAFPNLTHCVATCEAHTTLKNNYFSFNTTCLFSSATATVFLTGSQVAVSLVLPIFVNVPAVLLGMVLGENMIKGFASPIAADIEVFVNDSEVASNEIAPTGVEFEERAPSVTRGVLVVGLFVSNAAMMAPSIEQHNTSLRSFRGTIHQSGFDARPPLLRLVNVTTVADVTFRLGPYVTRIPVPSVQAGCAVCGLVTASNGTSLRGSSWVFEGITVDVARGSRFSLFGAAAGGSVVLPSREDVTLQCVRWVGRRLVPFGDGGSMLDRECGGSVTATTPLVVAAGLGGSGETLQAAAAFVGGASSVAAALGSLFGDAAASSDVQALAVLGMVMCAPSGLKAATGPMVYLLSPFAGLGSAWAGGGNVLLGTAVAGVHAAGVLLLG